MRSLLVLFALAAFSFASAAPPRPKIVGIANVAFKVSSLETARAFYGKVSGLAEAFTIQELTYFKVSDRQYIEVSPVLQDPKSDRLIHIGLETTDAQALRNYLAGQGVAVPEKIQTAPDGNLSFTVRDPDGYNVEFIQYQPESVQMRSAGKYLPDTRLSQHIFHAGMLVKDRPATDHFYRDILGFRHLMEVDSGRARTVAMLLPEGNDFIEYALLNNTNSPPAAVLGITNHVCLDVPDVQAAYQSVRERGYTPPRQPTLGQSGHWQLNLLDPDGSRTELMNRR